MGSGGCEQLISSDSPLEIVTFRWPGADTRLAPPWRPVTFPGGLVRPDGHPAGPSLEAFHILAGVDTSCPLDEEDTLSSERGVAWAEKAGSRELASGLIGSFTTG